MPYVPNGAKGYATTITTTITTAEAWGSTVIKALCY